MKEFDKLERVHINKPLAAWAVICGLTIGTGIATNNLTLAMGGLIVSGYGADLADKYENGQKRDLLVGKNG
jgi:hypothetical protein